MGVNVSGSYSNGDFSIAAGMGAGDNYRGWNAAAKYKGYGGGYGETYYGSSIGPDGQSNAQGVGGVSVFFNYNSFRLENDVFLGKDRWRTNAWELTIGKYSTGSYMYTNDGNEASMENTYDGKSSIWGKTGMKDLVHGKMEEYILLLCGLVYVKEIK